MGLEVADNTSKLPQHSTGMQLTRYLILKCEASVSLSVCAGLVIWPEGSTPMWDPGAVRDSNVTWESGLIVGMKSHSGPPRPCAMEQECRKQKNHYSGIITYTLVWRFVIMWSSRGLKFESEGSDLDVQSIHQEHIELPGIHADTMCKYIKWPKVVKSSLLSEQKKFNVKRFL